MNTDELTCAANLNSIPQANGNSRSRLDQVDDLIPSRKGNRRGLIALVTDLPGHDHRYAIDPSKIERDLGWRPREPFETRLAKTVGR